jgi:hypothetical protein
MAHGSVTTWTCDRCGREVSVDNGKLPDGWKLVELKALAAGTPTIKQWEICDGCSSQHHSFMAGRKPPIDD